jgi:hypothetical protein
MNETTTLQKYISDEKIPIQQSTIEIKLKPVQDIALSVCSIVLEVQSMVSTYTH